MSTIILKEEEIKEPDDFFDKCEDVNKYILTKIDKKNSILTGTGYNFIIPSNYNFIGRDETYSYISNGVNIYKVSTLFDTACYNGSYKPLPVGDQQLIPEKEYNLLLACSLLEKNENRESTKLKESITKLKKGDYSSFNIEPQTFDKLKNIKSYEVNYIIKNTLIRLLGMSNKKIRSEYLLENEYIKMIKEISNYCKDNSIDNDEYKGLIFRK